ncbi:MAG: HAD family hydrolase [Calditrichia bacterium]|nr:HAD family hydrolase [Calditrichia bacterium]
MKTKIKTICFDADDTLWINEPFFREGEKKFCDYLSEYLPEKESYAELFKTEMQNMESYGYGIKAFVLSMIETAIKITGKKVPADIIEKIINIGKEMLEKPVKLLDGVEPVLVKLSKKYKLIIATKGDLLDQERKLKKSGIIDYFHHVEIMSDKKEKDYIKLIKHLDIDIDEFLMVGNSLKSDVLPVLSLGGYAIHIPFWTTWIHEQADVNKIKNDKFHQVEKLIDILGIV